MPPLVHSLILQYPPSVNACIRASKKARSHVWVPFFFLRTSLYISLRPSEPIQSGLEPATVELIQASSNPILRHPSCNSGASSLHNPYRHVFSQGGMSEKGWELCVFFEMRAARWRGCPGRQETESSISSTRGTQPHSASFAWVKQPQ